MKTLKVAGKSDVNKMASMVAHLIQEGEDVELQAVGAAAVSQAVKSIAKAVRRARVGIKDPNRPIGSFIFLGPTGVGKTELCKALAEAMFSDEKNIIIHKIKNIYYIIIYNKAHKQVYNSYVIRYIFLLGLLHLFYICFYFFSYLITLTDLRFEVMDRNSDLQEMYS